MSQVDAGTGHTMRLIAAARFVMALPARRRAPNFAFRHPETFRNVISQSGAYWWPSSDGEPEAFARLVIASPPQPIRFFMDVRTYETDRTRSGPGMLTVNRHLRDVLRAKEYRISYREVNAAHEYLTWRGTIADAITYFFAPTR